MQDDARSNFYYLCGARRREEYQHGKVWRRWIGRSIRCKTSSPDPRVDAIESTGEGFRTCRPQHSPVSTDLLLTVGLLFSAIVMFVVGRPRTDAVALIMIILLPTLGIVTLPEAVAGFSDPNIILIASLFVIGDGLVRTGIAHRVGEFLIRHGGQSERRLVALLMLMVALMGSFMSSTAIVAIFIPIVLNIARKAEIPHARLIMPVGAAALTSGMLTLVATTSNLVVNSSMVYRGYPAFGLFDITRVGAPMLVVAIGYMMFASRRLHGPTPAASLPRPTMRDWIERYSLRGRAHWLRLRSASPLIGRSLDDIDLADDYGAHVVAVERRTPMGASVLLGNADTVLAGGDILLLDADADAEAFDVSALCTRYRLAQTTLSGAYFMDQTHEVGMAEVIVPPDSGLVGGIARNSALRRYGVTIVGLRRAGGPVAEGLQSTPLKVGDTLLVVGPWDSIFTLQSVEHDLVCLAMPIESESSVPAPHRAIEAMLCTALVIAMFMMPGIPNLFAGLTGALLMGFFGCVNWESAYRAIHWRSIVLIVGMLPFAIALQRTGGIDMVADGLVYVASEWGIHSMLAAVFTLTVIFGTVVSSTPTAVLMTPVAITMAEHLHMPPAPFAMTVAIAASAAYISPIATPVNALISSAGGYTFRDFVRIGVPITLAAGVICVALVPVFWPA
ncbi:citrate transporter [Pandoraea iniqua]|uniref:Citrate transporter n=1 Tax=Pandoraea iniqua TaxID=2508288 RepID=A0A5E4RQ92_9BURK|nr:citrate transporter [Pandoraea iniqua]